ncbi:hypothetical protein [Streptomyces sp. NPDC056144]|uniref:hypothetical protein n=1 Tax=unclassified Streptomyces TaxID=2593676 RepID=UPI0035DFF4CD
MPWWKRRRTFHGPFSVVDRLQERADELALARPGTPKALAAARDAVAAAEKHAQDERRRGTGVGRSGQRRLARALWRETSALLVAERGRETERPALRCWDTCTLLLDLRFVSEATVADELTGEVVGYLGVLTAALAELGRHEDVPRLLAAAEAAVAETNGPRTEQARARLAVYPLAMAADTYAAARIAGQWPLVALEATRATSAGRQAVETLRRHSAEGPTEIVEFARALQLVGRLLLVAERVEESATVLDEAIAALSGWARRGPALAAFLQGLRAERAGLDDVLARRRR